MSVTHVSRRLLQTRHWLSLVNQPLLPCVHRLQYLTVGRRVCALTHGFCVNTTRDLGSSNCPIRFENVLVISHDCNGAVLRSSLPEIVTALDKSSISRFYKLCPKQTKAVLAFVCRYDVSLSPPKGTRSAENMYNVVLPAMITAVAFVIVHAGSGKSRFLLFVYLFSILW